VINDKELKRFHDWLKGKGEHPSVVLAMRSLAEFELYAEEDEEDFRRAKTLARLRSRYDPEAAAALRGITWVEETVEPDTRMKRFRDWLQAKGNNPTAVLARWWIAEFEEAQDENRTQSGMMATQH
jgi:hypothetical protein